MIDAKRPSPQPSPDYGRGGDAPAPQPALDVGRGSGAPSPQPSPEHGRGGYAPALTYHVSRIRWLPLFLIWLLAFALRLALSQMERVVWGDEPFYLWLGRNWIMGQGYSFTGHPDVHHSPLFPWLAGVLYLVTHSLELASELLYALFGSLLVLPVYALGLVLYERRAALAAAALAAVFPALAVSVLHWGTMTEPLYMFFVTLGLWAGVLILRPCGQLSAVVPLDTNARDPWWAYPLAGASFGLAYLTRPEAFGYFVVAGVLFVFFRLVVRRFDVRFVLKALLYALAFGLAFLPYAYYTHLHTGSWMVSEKVGVAYLTGIGLAHGDTAAFDRATWGLDSTGLETFFFSSESYNVSMVQLVLDDPRTFLTILYMNTQRFVQALIDRTLFPYLLLPFVVLGLFKRGWTRARTVNELFLLASLAPVLGFVLFFIQARYLVAFLPVLILWTARGILDLSDWLIATVEDLHRAEGAPEGAPGWRMSPTWRSFCTLAPVALLILGLLLSYPAVLNAVKDTGSVRAEHRIVGERLASQVERDTIIMSRYPAIAFHADARWVPTPNASWPEILRYARHKGARYFAIDERELRYRPQLKGLVVGDDMPAQLRLVIESTANGERLVVYRLLDQ